MKYIVTVPVTDLRKIPQPYIDDKIQDFNQESQCLYGECLRVVQIINSWAQVEAIEQKKYAGSSWISYPGWIDTKHIQKVENYPEYNLIVQKPFFETQFFSVGTRLKGCEESESHWSITLHDGKIIHIEKCYIKEMLVQKNVRDKIISHSESFINNPYHWGGRSSYFKDFNHKTSLDCSALTQLLYRLEQIEIPRDAHDQYLFSKEIEYNDLKKADFIFLKNVDKPTRVNHVMLYIDEDLLLESTIDPGIVRVVSSKDKLGKELCDIRSGDQINGIIVTFGTVLINKPLA